MGVLKSAHGPIPQIAGVETIGDGREGTLGNTDVVLACEGTEERTGAEDFENGGDLFTAAEFELHLFL